MKNELVVIDTNILVSALITQNGYSKKIFDDLILTGKIKMCLSGPVFEEYEGVLNRQKFRKFPSFQKNAIDLMNQLKENGVWFDPKTPVKVLSDEDDDKFIELAMEAKAAFLVTGNINDFTFTTFEGVAICSPREYYERFIVL